MDVQADRCPVCLGSCHWHPEDGGPCWLGVCLLDHTTCPYCEGRGLARRWWSDDPFAWTRDDDGQAD